MVFKFKVLAFVYQIFFSFLFPFLSFSFLFLSFEKEKKAHRENFDHLNAFISTPNALEKLIVFNGVFGLCDNDEPDSLGSGLIRVHGLTLASGPSAYHAHS